LLFFLLLFLQEIFSNFLLAPALAVANAALRTRPIGAAQLCPEIKKSFSSNGKQKQRKRGKKGKKGKKRKKRRKK
jgi:hypothetical protein